MLWKAALWSGFFVSLSLSHNHFTMSIFSKIIKGEIPCYKIAENDQFLAFLDIFPMVPGHTLVIPKTEIDKFFDLPDELLSQMLVFAKPIAKAMERIFPCDRVGLSVLGLEVPHAHLHLVPINGSDDLNFTRRKLQLSKEEFEEIQRNIIEAMNA
jgi:histidine triad (HIT) family protein